MQHGQLYDNNRKKIGLRLLATLRCIKRSGSVRTLAEIIIKGLCLGLLAVSVTPHQVAAEDNVAQLSKPSSSLSAHEVAATLLSNETQPVVAPHPKRANFKGEEKSWDAEHVADWIVDSGDNRDMPFVIVDKMYAKVFVFDPDGLLSGAAPALVGQAPGDDSIPGIGDRKLSEIPPEERTTQAGRFVASLGYDLHRDVLWVDYDSALSLHPVVTNHPKERRLQRLASPMPLDHRISWGCINVPAKFYNNVVSPAFTGTPGIVYVLPDTQSISKIFPLYYVVE